MSSRDEQDTEAEGTTDDGASEANDAVAASKESKEEPAQSPLKEITQPFVDLVRAPRALWGINAGYFLEGVAYWGVLGYLAMFFSENVGLDDTRTSLMVGVLTWGITLSMFFFGGLADRWGVRTSMLSAFVLLLFGRVLLAAGPSLGLQSGMGGPLHLLAMGGIVLVVLGYGMYQPAAYAGVRQFTSPKTAAMGYAMLYALMNLGGFVPTFFPEIRKSIGIHGTFWVFAGLTFVSLVLTAGILTRKVAERAIAQAKAEKEAGKSEAERKKDEVDKADADNEKARVAKLSFGRRAIYWFRHHPFADAKFAFFIFALIPVQTLFAHQWLTMPMYVSRAYRPELQSSWELLVGDAPKVQYLLAIFNARSSGQWAEFLRMWVGENFEVAVNFNPLLIFILVPMVAALTQKRNVYNMMILGTFVMALPTFLLAIGASFWTLFAYIILMTLGEAMWQPRFLQYAAEIAPEGRTAAYMGVAQFPWFLTKMIVPIYAGWFLERYVPRTGPVHSETMWLIYGCIAVSSTVMLILAKGWIGKDFKTQAS